MSSTDVKSIAIRVLQMLRKQPTVSLKEIPVLYHEPGVVAGYRLPGQPLITYILSAFQLNNETVNIWTHAIGFVVILCKTLFLLEEFGADDIRIVPILGFGICCLLYTILSVTAHTIHSASPSIHYTCFQADYAGIGLYAFGSALPIFYLSTDNQTRDSLNFWFLPVLCIFSWISFLCCCIAKIRYRRPYPFARKLWHIIPFGVQMLSTMSLLHRRVARCHLEGQTCDDPALDTYRNVFILALLGGLTFSSHLPEKLWPGHFDVIGQGHQVFHVVAIILNLAQISAARDDILQANPDIAPDNHKIPSLSYLLCVIFVLCLCNLITLFLLRPFVLQRIQADEKLEKRK